MKKQIVIILLFTIPFSGFSQNKKEQIEELNIRIDSLKNIVQLQTGNLKRKDDELIENQIQIERLKSRNNNYQKSMDSLRLENTNLKNPKIQWVGKYDYFQFEGEDFPFLEITNQTNEGFDFRLRQTCYIEGFDAFAEYFGRAKFGSNSSLYAKATKVNDGNEESIVDIKFTYTKDEIFINLGMNDEGYLLCMENGTIISVSTIKK